MTLEAKTFLDFGVAPAACKLEHERDLVSGRWISRLQIAFRKNRTLLTLMAMSGASKFMLVILSEIMD